MTEPVRGPVPDQTTTARHQVVIAGAGPTGLMLAAELALAGIDVVLVERRLTQDLEGHRAGGLHARTIEIMDMRGIADRFLAEGQVAQVAGFAWIPLDISDFPTRHPYGLALPQARIERILLGRVEELGVPILRGREVTGFAQDDDGVDVALDDGASLRAEWLVGCDGGRSVVRKAAGIEFAGWDAGVSHLIAEVHMTEAPPMGLRRDALGIHALRPLEDGRVGVMVTEPRVGRTDEPTLDYLAEVVTAVYGTDFGLHGPAWISRFTDAARQATSYRSRRVPLAGDAAHVHYPAGGQGLNLGIHDAVNLGWKLAHVVRKTADDDLLDTYHAERHPVAARLLRDTLAQVALLRTDDRTEALREVVAELLRMDEPRRRLGGIMSGLDVRYDLGEGHPLVGRRMPDLDIVTAEGPTRVYALLQEGEAVVLRFDGSAEVELPAAWQGVRVVDAEYDGRWEVPGVGKVEGPKVVLVRPDGVVG